MTDSPAKPDGEIFGELLALIEVNGFGVGRAVSRLIEEGNDPEQVEKLAASHWDYEPQEVVE